MASCNNQSDMTSKTRPIAPLIFGFLISLLPWLSFTFLTYTIFQTIRLGDPWMSAFAGSTYLILVLLFVCMRELGKLKADDRCSRKSKLLRIAVWILSTLLNILFTFRVCLILDSVIMSCFVWSIACATSVFGFYVFFLSKQEEEQASECYVPLPNKDINPHV